jgi:glucokinase
MAIIGIDLGGTNVRVGLVEENRLIKVESKPINNKGTKEEIVNDIFNLINKFEIDKIEGIGVGVPGVVDLKNGIVYEVQNIPSWKEVRLMEILNNKYNIPVYINNDANCFAAGEKYFGKGQEYKNIVGLIVGTGLGAGIFMNGKLYSGSNCGAGEFGMIPFKESILENYCSGQFFQINYGKKGSDIYTQALGGDKAAQNIFYEFGLNLGEAIKIILYSIDPDIIILGGSVSKAFNLFQSSMNESISSFAYSKAKNNFKIAVSEIENIAILGAAALYMDAQTSN